MSAALPLVADTNVGAIVLEVATKNLVLPGVSIDSRITDGSIERSMEAASTLSLTVDDAHRDLLRSGVFSQQIDLELDGQWWRLTAVSKSGSSIELTFVDRVVAYLKAKSGPRKAARSKMTRAEFILSLVQELKPPVEFVCPDLHTQQKVAITTAAQKLTPTARATALGKGLSPGQTLTVKHHPASASQRALGERLLDVAASLSAPHNACVALISSAITESTIQNINFGDVAGLRYGGSLGVLQVLKSTADNLGISQMDPEACAKTYLTRGFRGLGGAIELALKHPDWTPAWIGENVMGIGEAKVNEQWHDEAEVWVNAYAGLPTKLKVKPSAAIGATSSATSQPTTFSTTTAATAPFQFQRGGTNGKRENSWHAMQRLASDVQWRCFVVDGRVYYASEATLLQQKPELSISEDTLGVDAIDFNVDNGKDSSEATVQARASRWAVPPGSVVELYNCGPADGRWLVSQVTRGIFDAEATITLKRVTLPLLEPAADPSSAAAKAAAKVDPSQPYGVTPSLAAKGGSKGARAWAAAQAMDAKQYPYIWGGGHARCGVPNHTGLVNPYTGQVDAGIGYDCSGSTCAILGAAEMGFTIGGGVMGSGSIASSWGEPGKGSELTVYANSVHVFIVFHTPQGDKHFGTGHWGKSWSGPGFNPEMHPLSGFSPRHFPGS